MFTVRPHPPKGPSSAPFTSPDGAVVAFGGRFPALFLLLWACPCIFVCLLLCTLFLGICAPGLSAVELYFFAFALVGPLGWAAPPPHIRGSSPRPVGRWLWSFSVSRSFPRPAFCPLLLVAPFFLGPSFFSGSLLRFFSLLFGPFPGPSFFPVPVLLFGLSFLFVPSFLLGTPFILVSSPVLLSASWYIFFCLALLYFLSLCFLIFFYLFLFISICPPKGLRKGRVGVGTLSSGGCGKWVRPWGKHYFNPTLPYEGLKECMS